MFITILKKASTALFFLVFFTNALYANALLISPVDPIIESNQQAVALWLNNQGETPVVLQIRSMLWQQSEFKDHYLDTQNDLMVSPPFATIEPGKKQLIRLIKGRMFTPSEEKAFRLLIDEIPATADASALTASEPRSAFIGVQFQMRYSIPLFAVGEGLILKNNVENKRVATKPTLRAKLVTVEGKKYLQIDNLGAIHARISNVVWQEGVKKIVVNPGLLGYVLSGSQMRWPVTNISVSGLLKAKINDLDDVTIPFS